MSRVFVTALVALTITSAMASSASAFQCVARSPNGAMGSASGLLVLERAQSIALRRCIINGGNLNGVLCHVVYCHH